MNAMNSIAALWGQRGLKKYSTVATGVTENIDPDKGIHVFEGTATATYSINPLNSHIGIPMFFGATHTSILTVKLNSTAILTMSSDTAAGTATAFLVWDGTRYHKLINY